MLEEAERHPPVGQRREGASVRSDEREERLLGVLLRSGLQVGICELEARLVEAWVELYGPLEVGDSFVEPLESVDLELSERREPARIGDRVLASTRDEVL